MDKQIIEDLLVCPKCRGDIRLIQDKLICNNCKSFFSGEDGIYSLLDDRLNDYDIEQQIVFDKVCSGYDHYLNSQPFYTLIRDKYVLPYWLKENFDGKIVLDLGCGTSWATSEILPQVSVLINLDISRENLKFAKNRLGVEKVIYIQANMKNLPFRNQKFDIITCFWALHHLQEVKVAAEEIKRILKDKGIFLGIEPNIRYTWVEFWSDLLHLPLSFKKQVLTLHKVIQRYTHKRLEKEQYYMRGIQLKHNCHAGIIGFERYRNIFNDLFFQFDFKPVGLEIILPRFFMNKNRFLVNLLFRFSDWCIKYFNKQTKGLFFIIKATQKK